MYDHFRVIPLFMYFGTCLCLKAVRKFSGWRKGRNIILTDYNIFFLYSLKSSKKLREMISFIIFEFY